MTTTPQCPECSGPWLYSFTFRHARPCSLAYAMDSTIAADNDRLFTIGPFIRTSTAAELTLATALGWVQPVGPDGSPLPMQTIVRFMTASIAARSLQPAGGGVRWTPPEPTMLDLSAPIQLGPTGAPSA